MPEREKLKLKDCKSAQNAVLEAVRRYGCFPAGFRPGRGNVKWNSIGSEQSVGIFPLQGAVYIKKYISGTFKAQMPFQIMYKSFPTNSSAAMNAQTMLEGLAGFLEGCDVEFENDGMEMESMEQTSVVYKVDENEEYQVCAVNMKMVYVCKGGR